MSLDFLDTYEKYVHEDVKADVSADTELFKLDKVEEKAEEMKQETPSSHLSDEDIERIAKKLAEMQQASATKVIENEQVKEKEDEQNG